MQQQILWILLLAMHVAAVDWNGNNWALQCDFAGNDFTNVLSRAEECGGKCDANSQCTHFVWSNFGGGTCWLKNGAVSKDRAVQSTPGMVCGVKGGQSPPASQPANCFERTMDFANGPVPGWDLQGTDARQGWANQEWRLHSGPTRDEGWSRMRYKDFTFNSHPGAWTNIKVKVRGAPDGGKNSAAYLIQSKGDWSNKGAEQDTTKDEIDFFEYYGGSKVDTFNVFRNGHTISGFPKTYPITDAGNTAYTYEIVLDNRKRTLMFMVWDQRGLLRYSDTVTGANVPSNPMELFISLWDCSGLFGHCPGKFAGDSYMAVLSVYIKAC